MVTFSVAILILILGYILYGTLVTRVFGYDSKRKTPAYTLRDGVDYVPMPGWKIYTIQFLNIAGTGPIFGAIMGAQFGTSAYLWIVLGCIFGGAVHDYFSGMISLRHRGESLPNMVGRYLGVNAQRCIVILTLVLMLLLGAVFVYTPAEILGDMTPVFNIGGLVVTPKIAMIGWMIIIFLYYFIASFFPIDKIIGKIYPMFAFALFFMAFGIMWYLFMHWPSIPEITDGLQNMKAEPENHPIFPMLFVTIACGAISGFHATQSPLMARCMTNERQGRPIFYGAMITEGIIALVWCAAANAYFNEIKGADISSLSAGYFVNHISRDWLGRVGGILALLGVVFAPITSGDTAFRSMRLVIADHIKLDQKKAINKMKICIPVFILAIVVLNFSMLHPSGFHTLWRYFAWVNQTLASVTLWACTVYLFRQKGYWHLITLIPAMFMTLVVITYILVAPEGFGLINYYNWVLSGAALATLLISCWFYKTQLTIVKAPDFKKEI